uniref:NADH-ubiquinone oxidoreductase chain 5 n=1 Tax=Brasilocerus sp. 2 DTA-2012 TaxID=1176494 RepID=A0A0H3UL09_9COLE|nr:NADH dehydrogenase subunit 5 [Brasilocerus sp. 2 DTA-2012]
MIICIYLSCGFFFLSSFSMFFGLYFLILDYSLILELGVLSLNSVVIYVSLLFDWMSLLFLSFILLISSMVCYYSKEYMHGDCNLDRFMLLVMMFVVSMVFLVISPNMIMIMFGWDMLGVVSYCLVAYYDNSKSHNAAMLTALMNRLGDVGVLFSIAWMFNYGSFNFLSYFNLMYYDSSMALVGLMVVLASLTKSAQVPFSSWLPASMAAPTPVSSLVHSSTLVTAGVYLLIRFFPCFSDEFLSFLLFISLMTMFISSVSANFEFDLKKIIAFSTMSQLGFMISIMSLGEVDLSYYHMLIHALFKALMFMCAGYLIHNLSGCQDIRFLGGFVYKFPLVFMIMSISVFSLCGVPFMSGFYSKDLVLEVMSMKIYSFFIYFVYYFSCGLTVSYSFRLYFYLVLGWSGQGGIFKISNGRVMLNSMLVMAFFTVFMGSLLNWVFFSSLYFICLPYSMKLMIYFFIFLGGFIGYQFSFYSYSFELIHKSWINKSLFCYSIFNLSNLSVYGFNKYFIDLGDIFMKTYDQGWFEYYGSQKIFFNIVYSLKIFQLLSLNSLKVFMSLMIFFLIFYLLI